MIEAMARGSADRDASIFLNLQEEREDTGTLAARLSSSKLVTVDQDDARGDSLDILPSGASERCRCATH
jgi:hypothetical protein